MTEQSSLFDDYMCDRWYRDDMCWECDNYATDRRPSECFKRKCGTCANCELPTFRHFAGCEYNPIKGEYFRDRLK